jgi:outer membrane protein assembly factor BamB
MGEVRGQWHLVFKTQAAIVGLDPRTGEKLWRIPFRVPMDNTIVTPLFVGDRLVTSDYQMGMHAWRIEPDGASWVARELWENRTASLFTSSPVTTAGRLVGFSHLRKGHLFVLDPDNGEISWRGQPRWGEHASLIASGDEVLVFKDDGSLFVGRVSANGFQTFRSHRLGSAMMWAHPAIVDDRIIVRDGGRVAVYSPGRADAGPDHRAR